MYICFDYCFPFWCKKKPRLQRARETPHFIDFISPKCFLRLSYVRSLLAVRLFNIVGHPPLILKEYMCPCLQTYYSMHSPPGWNIGWFSALWSFPRDLHTLKRFCEARLNITKRILKRTLFHFSPVCKFQLRRTVCKFRPKCTHVLQMTQDWLFLHLC